MLHERTGNSVSCLCNPKCKFSVSQHTAKGKLHTADDCTICNGPITEDREIKSSVTEKMLLS